MATREENELLTRVGPGSPMGELLRRYWQPVALVDELKERPIKRVRILGEDLVLYTEDREHYGLVGERCSHRGASLAYGWIEGCNIRCRYHGWLYGPEGQCLEQPAEPAESTYKERIRHPAYPVQKLAGLLFAYLGPEPAPLLPRWDVLIREDGELKIAALPQLDCNWLQPMENASDFAHTYYLHSGHRDAPQVWGKPITYDYEVFEWGMWKKLLVPGEDGLELVNAHPILFPNILLNQVNRKYLEYRVPIDDTHTLIYNVGFYPTPDGSKVEQPGGPSIQYVAPYKDERGVFRIDFTFAQDYMAWETAGEIYDRTQEHLASSDRGVTLFRVLLKDQLEKLKRGEDPMGVIRDPKENLMISVPCINKTPPRQNKPDSVTGAPPIPGVMTRYIE